MFQTHSNTVFSVMHSKAMKRRFVTIMLPAFRQGAQEFKPWIFAGWFGSLKRKLAKKVQMRSNELPSIVYNLPPIYRV